MSEITVEEFLASYSAEVRDLALQTRRLVLDAIPTALEIVDPPSKIIAYGFGRKYSDLICAIAPYPSYVNLMFGKGATLPDPEGLLAGTGKRARHVRIAALEDVRRPGILALLQAAVELQHH